MAKSRVEELLASGEVILIETQQHWMAALRYALRPIIVGLIAALLVVINNWLGFDEDSFLSFINDLIRWAAAILIIVTVVWLPIDLIRWDTRRYALTNRRAIRTEGLMRRSTFDSSLEQINDIGQVETWFGRMLGYSDLTLFTASDVANETYEQLRDGLQFKKAVLDAKEAIREGMPLTALPEGFIVRGGTNEASMRAEGKQEEANKKFGAPAGEPVEEAAAPAAAAAAAPVAPETAAAQQVAPAPPPEPEPVVPPPAAPAPPPEPEPVVAPEPPPEPEPVVTPSAPEPVAEPALVAEDEPAAEPESVAPSAPEPEPEPVEALEPEAEPAAEPEAAEPEAAEPEAAEPEAAEPEVAEPEVEPAAEPEEAEAAAEPAAETTEEPEAKPKTKRKSAADDKGGGGGAPTSV